MKQYYFYCLILLAYVSATAQPPVVQDKSADSKIAEVYGTMFDSMVSNDKDRHQMLVDMLQLRAAFVEEAESIGEKFPKISSVALFNKYNPGLQRDATGSSFSKSTFNVLKYKIPFTSNRTLVYRIDGTNFLLVVNPQTIRKS